MTDDAPTPAPADEPAETPDEHTEDTAPAEPEAPADTPEDGKAGREAAKYRRQLRDAESARDAAIAERDSARRTLVEHLAAGLGIRPAGLWASGAQLADLVDDAGNVDTQRVTDAVNAAVKALGLNRPPKDDQSAGRGGPADAPDRPLDDFAAAFAPRH